LSVYGNTNGDGTPIQPDSIFPGNIGAGAGWEGAANFSGISPWIIPYYAGADNFLLGVTGNLKFTGTNWYTSTDASNNGGWGWLGPNDGSVALYSVPTSTPAAGQTVTPAALVNDKVIAVDTSGNITLKGNVGLAGAASPSNPVRLMIGQNADAVNSQIEINSASGQHEDIQFNLNGANSAYIVNNNSGSPVHNIPNNSFGLAAGAYALSLSTNNGEAIHVTPVGVITANGNNLPTAEGTPSAGYATCWKTVGTNPTLGYCSTVVGATGTCTCN
jgi:hypothetical protein